MPCVAGEGVFCQAWRGAGGWRKWGCLGGVSATPSGGVVFVCVTCLDHVILSSVYVVPAQRGQKWICVKRLLMDSIKCSILK